MSDYNELRALALAATPGPWKTDRHLGSRSGEVLICFDAQDRGRGIAIAETVPGTGEEYCNADYIAAANPATVLALLDELEAAHASRREAQARVAELTEKMQARVDKLTEKVQALGRDVHRNNLDAARYRLLRAAEWRGFPGIVVYKQDTGEMHVVTWVDADAAIDAAMRAGCVR